MMLSARKGLGPRLKELWVEELVRESLVNRGHSQNSGLSPVYRGVKPQLIYGGRLVYCDVV